MTRTQTPLESSGHKPQFGEARVVETPDRLTSELSASSATTATPVGIRAASSPLAATTMLIGSGSANRSRAAMIPFDTRPRMTRSDTPFSATSTIVPMAGRTALGTPGGHPTRASTSPVSRTHAARTRDGSPTTDTAMVAGWSASGGTMRSTGCPRAASNSGREIATSYSP